MPGLTLIAGVGADETASKPSIIEPSTGLAVGWNGYSGYPVQTVRTADGWALLEGAAYGATSGEVVSALTELSKSFQADPLGGRSAAERWASEVDGDFLLVLAAPARRQLLVVNDTLGRLELFIRRSGNTTILARELKSASSFGARANADILACAQMLTFGWPLGDRTQLAGISRLPAGSSILVGLDDGTADARRYCSWNFEELQAAPRSLSQSVEQLIPEFVGACRAQSRWAEARLPLISLSGGLDSRAVASGYSSAAAPFTAVTFRSADTDNGADVEIARRVAAALGAPWREFQLDCATWQDGEWLIAMRDGLNDIGVVHVQRFLERLRDEFGPRACYVTGDGGDKILPDLRPAGHLRSLDGLVDHRLARATWPVSTAAALVGLTAGEVRESIRAHLAEYPERDMDFREVHFIAMERGLHYMLEGEERNRVILWSMTPMFAQSLFRQAMSVPAAQKKDHRLYAEFLRALNPAVASLPNADWQAPLGSTKARLGAATRKLFGKLPAGAKQTVRRLLRDREAPVSGQFQQRFRRLAREPRVLAVFKADVLDSIPIERCSRFQFNVLTSLMLYFSLQNSAK